MKSKSKQPLSSYERAQKRVQDIKGFYGHLTAYIIVNLVLLLSRDHFRFMLLTDAIFDDADFLNWIDWNLLGTPIIWGVFLAIHAIGTFGKNPILGKSWEERQIKKYMNKDTY